MELAAWIVSGLLAAVFAAAGLMKLLTPYEKVTANPNMAWAGDFSAGQVKAIGALEVLGALGVVLPWALDVVPVLSPIAAIGLAVVMVGAIATHLRRSEKDALPIAGVLLALAVALPVLQFSVL